VECFSVPLVEVDRDVVEFSADRATAGINCAMVIAKSSPLAERFWALYVLYPKTLNHGPI